MIQIENILEDLDGNGFNQKDLVEVSTKLTIFSNLKKELSDILSRYYDDEELFDILGMLKQPNSQRGYMSHYLGESLTEKQKNVYLLYTVEGMSHGDISKLLGVSKSTIQSHLSRARLKLRELELERLGDVTPELHKKILENSPRLTDRQREYYSMYYIEGKTTKEIVKELGVDRRTAQFMISHAKSRITVPININAEIKKRRKMNA